MQRLLTNSGPIAHLSGVGPLTGEIEDLDKHIWSAGLGILV